MYSTVKMILLKIAIERSIEATETVIPIIFQYSCQVSGKINSKNSEIYSFRKQHLRKKIPHKIISYELSFATFKVIYSVLLLTQVEFVIQSLNSVNSEEMARMPSGKAFILRNFPTLVEQLKAQDKLPALVFR